MTPSPPLLTEPDAMNEAIIKARAAAHTLRSRGKSATLRFSLLEGRGWITTTSEEMVRAMNALWNAALNEDAAA